jgi:hypothetical protein
MLVEINCVCVAKYEKLPKPKTKLELEIQPPAVHSIPFVNQGRHLFILSGFWLMILDLVDN